MFTILCTYLFEKIFSFLAYYDDNYNKSFVESMDKHMNDGPYGYRDGKFDVTVQQGDVVINAGAWIGDFSAYAVTKGAKIYAFEPDGETFTILCETAKLNENCIIQIQKGLSDVEKETFLSIEKSGVGNFICAEKNSTSETINLTTLDKFTEENRLERVDFIKSDIVRCGTGFVARGNKRIKNFCSQVGDMYLSLT
jgi:FkbM family methyltransferase